MAVATPPMGPRASHFSHPIKVADLFDQNNHISPVTEVSSFSPSIQRQLPIDSDSDSSLSHENLRLHNDEQTRYHVSDLPSDIQITVENAASSSYSSPSSVASSSHQPENSNEDNTHTPFPSTVDTDTDRPNRVHFRPRVRITSGISRHRHLHSPLSPSFINRGFLSYTPNSSRSSSPSSSISAPLRSRSDDETDKPGWGPLGQRVALLSHKSRRRSKDRWKRHHESRPDVCEHTPLLHPHYRPLSDGDNERGDDEYISPQHAVDLYFGTWPGRLLNHRWWWWQIEPVVCCGCIDESDVE